MPLTLLATTDTQIIRVVEALYNQTPGYTYLANFRTFTTDNGIDSFANAMAASFASSTDAALAATVTANLGLTGDALTAGNAYLEAQFAAAPAARGKAVLDAMNALATLESDATYGAAATAFNADVVASTSYSIVTTNTNALAAGAGQTYTLTTANDAFTGTTGGDTFNASNAAGTAAGQTMNTADSVDGGAGIDTLNATVGAANTYALAGVSNVENLSANFSKAGTISMLGSTGVTSVANSGSTAPGVFSNITPAGTSLTVSNTGSNTTFGFVNAALTGTTDTAAVTVSNVTGAAQVNVQPASGTNGFETIALTSTGGANSITLNDATSTGLTGVTVSGDQNLTLVTTPATITSIDASAMTGGLTHTATNAAATTITGGAGNDAITAEATLANDNISGGAGNDTITFTATLDVTDTVNGGDGTDAIVGISADLVALAVPATATISNFETITVSDALGGALTTANVQAGITTVNLAAGSGTQTLTMEAGAQTVNVAAANTGVLTVADTGTATTDSLSINNTAAATDVLGGQNLTITGYETVTLTTTGAGAATTQTLAAVSMTSDTGGTDTLTVAGSNTLTTNAITADTIDASGLTGTAVLTMGAAAVAAAGGSITITGGDAAAGDTLVGDANDSSIITGGAGNDTVTGGSDHDTLNGNDGVDQITSAAGNDTIDAGAGNDTIVMAGNLATGDVVDGGDGTDIISITTANLTTLAGYSISAATALNGKISNVEQLTVSDAVNVGANFDMARMDSINNIYLAAGITGNEGFSGLASGATVTDVVVDNANTDILTMALGDSTGTADVLNYTMTNAAGIDFGVLAVSGVETLNITANEATANATVRVDIIGLNITTSTNGTAVNIAGTETVTVDTAIAAQTITSTTSGAFIMTNTTGSALAQTITSGAGADSVYGGGGADTIDTGAGADSIVAGTGADNITGGTGADTIDGGAGNDTITLTETTAGVDDVVLNWSEDGTYIDTIVGFTTLTGGDEINLDISSLESVSTSGGVHTAQTDIVGMFDGVSDTADTIQVMTAAAAAAANANVFIISGGIIDSTGSLEDALEAGGAYALSAVHANVDQHDIFFAAYTDGADAYVSSVRVVTDSNTATFATGELDATNLVKISGVTAITSTTFAADNFALIA